LSWSQQAVVWKASDVHPLGYPHGRGDRADGQEAREGTNGRITIQMYPSMQLGGEKEMIEQAQVGALQIARISVGAMGPVVDELNVLQPAVHLPRRSAHAQGHRRPDRPDLLDKVSELRSRGWSRSAGWIAAPATSTRTSR
jgi:TRAP-type C4-dicarboxylate transport system substrate-binding protein